jgi:predicted RNA binding protein YcfA (HicA-like mRNA interferase family)
MPKLPRLTAREICSILEKLGFSMARQSGSHMIYKNAEGRVPHPAVFRVRFLSRA